MDTRSFPTNRLRHLLSFAVLFLSACGSPLPRQAEVLQKGRACCSSIEQVPISGATANGAFSATLNDQTPIFEFTQGRSHFVAMSIGSQRNLEVRTWHQGNTTIDWQIFCPMITFLDKDKHFLEARELNDMSFTRAGFIDNARFTQTISSPSLAAYAVVHSPADSIGRSLSDKINDPGRAVIIGKFGYFIPGNDSISIPCGQQGKITIAPQ